MNEQSQSVAVAHSFADRVRAFHQDLPIEERHLLEQVFALATLAASDGQDTKGHGIVPSAPLAVRRNELAIESVLGLRSVGPKGFSWGESQTGSF
ncbi:MAG: hypothetical protein ACRDJE_27215 [Dehalococcoidia bacterium]